MAFHAQRRLWEAEQLYKHALKADDRHFVSLYHLGLLYLQQSRFKHAALCRSDGAIACYKAARAVSPTDSRARKKRASVVDLLGRTDEEVELFRQATAVTPGDHEAHNGLGVALQALGRLDEATRALE